MEFLEILGQLNSDQKRQIFDELRKEFPIHKLEADWNISAEFVLEAINRSQDITKRGVRGIIAELCFLHYVIQPMSPRGWSNVELMGDLPYDALIENGNSGQQVKIQAKLQRMKKGQPLLAADHSKRKFSGFPGWWVAECQKTRSGKDEDGQDTRPYRFGEFDILAVSLHPSTGDWSRFMFTPGKTLFPRSDDSSLIEIFQPVPPTKEPNWTNSLEECISWL